MPAEKQPTVAGVPVRVPRFSGRDIVAGFTNAITNIPDAMANAVLAGVNPIQGLYAIMLGTPTASLGTGSQLMTVATTGAMALIVGDTLARTPADQRIGALVALTLLVGAIQIVLGLARAGSLLRFVSNSVLRGFLTGVAINIVLSQVSELTGYSSIFHNKLVKVADTLFHPSSLHFATLGVGLLTIVVVLLVERIKPLKEFAFFIALVVATLVSVGFHLDVANVRSLAEIPGRLPTLQVPKLATMVNMLIPAFSLGIVGLIQGAGVSKSVPNRDGSFPDVNRDFIGQGVGNAVSGAFGGLPVGGSVGSTALLVQLGAVSRVANFLVGPIVLLVVLFFSHAVEMIPLTCLAALLIIIGVRAVNFEAVRTVWQTSLPSRVIMTVTLVAMFVVPVQYAVLIGVALSVVQYVYSASLDIRVVELKRGPDGLFSEAPAPASLPSDQVTAIDIYGSVFYAGTDIIDRLLPDTTESRNAVMVLRLRGRTDVGSTFITLLERYARNLRGCGGALLLDGVGPELLHQLERTGAADVIGRDNLFEAQPQLTASLSEAIDAAEKRLHEGESLR